MLINQKIGNINFFALHNRKIDYLLVEWYETEKRIQHKKSIGGTDVAMKFLNENPRLTEGDIIYEDDFKVIVIEIKECEASIVGPKSMYEMASVCYEIGNKHIPLFYQQDEILFAYEPTLHQLLAGAGYHIRKEQRKLTNPLKTSVTPHGHSGQPSLFSKIMKRTNPGI